MKDFRLGTTEFGEFVAKEAIPVFVAMVQAGHAIQWDEAGGGRVRVHHFLTCRVCENNTLQQQ